MKRDLLFSNQLIVIDGGMGTILQATGLPAGQCPEEWNLSHPDAVAAIHREYAAAGARVMTTNTFGGNRIKLAEFGLADRQEAICRAAVRAARQAGDGVLLTGSLGPTGKLFPPMGDLDFATARSVFAEQARHLAAAGVELFSIETMADLAEAKAALLGIQDAAGGAGRDFPVLVQMTFDAEGRTLTGSTPQVVAAAFSSLRPLAVGTNCGLGPDGMLAIVRALRAFGAAPVVALPNAGLPELVDGKTLFRMGPDEFAAGTARLVKDGVRFVGGCCGTTPAHIRELLARLAAEGIAPPADPAPVTGTMVASRRRVVVFGTGRPFAVIGERINPTGREDLLAELVAGKLDLVRRDAREQAAANAALLDINVGGAGVDEARLLPAAAAAAQEAAELPLSLDTPDLAALRAALPAAYGKPLLNSVSGEPHKLETWLPLVKEYGTAAVVLALAGKALPATVADRLAAIARVVDAARELGIPLRDLVVDVLALTVSARPDGALQALAALREVKQRWPEVSTVLGVSNISFGLPRRGELNSAFLAMAIGSGLDAGIINPRDAQMPITAGAADVLTGRDPAARRFIRGPGAAAVAEEAWTGPAQAVLAGDADALPGLLQERLEAGASPLALVNDELIPAITEVGERYNRGDYFLPQLMLAAEAMKRGFTFLKPHLGRGESPRRGTVILATVKNDIHDIGKNIVRVMCENSGFRVLDLGKDVGAEALVAALGREPVDAIGLSALMTTTMAEMPALARAARAAGFAGPVLAGGAVVTRSFAETFGAHHAPDAVAAVKLLTRLLGSKPRPPA